MRIQLAILLLACQSAFAAIGAKTIWHLSPTATAANVNGAGFDYGNASFATDMTCTSCTGTAPVVSSATQLFVLGDAPTGALFFIGSGGSHLVTNCWFPITSVAINAITLNATTGAGICLDATKGTPTPKWVVTTSAGISSDGTATISSGTNPWSIDYTQTDTAPFAAVADLTIDATVNTKVTSATVVFKASHIGNVINITAGTSWTQGWREINSVATAAATLDSSPSAAANVNLGTFYLGGGVKLNSSTTSRTDANFFNAQATAGNRFMVKAGTYTTAATIAAANGGTGNPTIVEGFQTVRGDAPTGSNRPILNLGANGYGGSNQLRMENIAIYGTGSTLWAGVGTSYNTLINTSIINTSTTASRNAIGVGGAFILSGGDYSSYRGVAIISSNTSAPVFLVGVHVHDSDLGINNGNNLPMTIAFSVFEHNVTSAIKTTTSNTLTMWLMNNTIYGAENKLGTCVSWASGTISIMMQNNIIYGCTTGISHADSQTTTMNYSDWNDMFNNTTNVSNWAIGSNSLALDPQFTNVHQQTGTAATSSTNVLTDGAATFTSVVNDQDTCYLSAGTGTGFAAGIYPIHSHTTTTVTFSTPLGTAVNVTTSGAGTGITYECTYGRNFAIGTNLKAKGTPGAFTGAPTTGFLDIGAVQRVESTGSSTKGFTFASLFPQFELPIR